MNTPPASSGAAEPTAAGTTAAVETLLETTRALVGVAHRALERLDDEVSLPQFRLLLVLAESGPTPSTTAAARLGAVGSSVTRLADRLEQSGHVHRRRSETHRSVVLLELSESGRGLVERVLAERRAELAALVDRLPADTVPRVATTLRAVCDAVDPGSPGHGPMELIAR